MLTLLSCYVCLFNAIVLIHSDTAEIIVEFEEVIVV